MCECDCLRQALYAVVSFVAMSSILVLSCASEHRWKRSTTHHYSFRSIEWGKKAVAFEQMKDVFHEFYCGWYSYDSLSLLNSVFLHNRNGSANKVVNKLAIISFSILWNFIYTKSICSTHLIQYNFKCRFFIQSQPVQCIQGHRML